MLAPSPISASPMYARCGTLAPAQRRLDLGELGAVVDAGGLVGIVGNDADDGVSRLPEDADRVGQVVLALRVLGTQTAERGCQQPAPEAVDRRVDLADLELVGSRVGVLDDVVDAAVLVANDTPVSGGWMEDRSEDRGGGAGLAMSTGERRQGLGAQQRRVTGHDEQVVLGVEIEHAGGERDAGGVAGAALDTLLDELDGELGRELPLPRLPTS